MTVAVADVAVDGQGLLQITSRARIVTSHPPHAPEQPGVAPAPDLRQLSTALEHINAELHDAGQPQSP